jgi:hypothetical protein
MSLAPKFNELVFFPRPIEQAGRRRSQELKKASHRNRRGSLPRQVKYESPRFMGGAGAGIDPLEDFSEAARKELRQGQLLKFTATSH